MPQTAEFFYDVISPTAYLAAHRIPAMMERTGGKIIYRPFFLGGVMQTTGNRPPGAVAAKGKWMSADMQRYAKRDGLVLNMNPHFPNLNTLHIQRASVAWSERPEFPAFLAAMLAAVWVRGVNVGEKDALTAEVAAAGVDTEEFWAAATDEANKAKLKANTEEAIARGAFGAPTFFVGDEMHFGQDRTDWVEAAMRR